MYFVYAIRSTVKNYIYVGMTNNVERRLAEHNNGENKSTKAYKPFELIYLEAFADRANARKKEVHLKAGVGKEFLRTLQ